VGRNAHKRIRDHLADVRTRDPEGADRVGYELGCALNAATWGLIAPYRQRAMIGPVRSQAAPSADDARSARIKADEERRAKILEARAAEAEESRRRTFGLPP